MGMAIGWSPGNPHDCSFLLHRRTVMLRALPEPHHDEHGNVTEAIQSNVNKKIRVAKAQSEIDRILAGPDAPFDAESELKKVVSIVATTEESEEDTIIENVMYKAVNEQDFELAAIKKHELDQLQMDDALAVLQVNAAFYRAFSQRDTEHMKSLWVVDNDSVCINPSSPPLMGSKQIDNSWDLMFRSSSKFQSWVEPANIRVAMRGSSTAVVTCDELVFARRFVRGQKRQSEQINTLTATNIFRRIDSKWLMAHHHSSWHHESAASRYALNAATMHRPNDGSASQKVEKDMDIKMDGILGAKNFGPMLGDQIPNILKGNGKVKVVRGNLADLLGGNLKDILSNKGSDESSEAVIEFHEFKNTDEDDEDRDEDDEDDYDDETEMYSQDGVNNNAVSVVKQFSDIKSNANEKFEKTRIIQRRQSCIRLLRQLCGKGTISPKQKRILLTDIISCSAKEEASLVEAAFELLYDGDADLDAAEEDFADQCRVLAGALAEH